MEILEKVKSWARYLKQQAQILQVVYSDERTPTKAKILIWITLGYLFSPIDLIPDFIPILGLLDDIIIVPLLISLTIKVIPKQVWAEASEFIKTQPQEKWKRNMYILIFIGLIWLFCIWTIIKFGMTYYKK